MAKRAAGFARFVSRYPNHRIVMKPARTIVNPATLLPEVVPGKSIQFVAGEFVTEDPKEIEFLRAYKLNGIDYTEDESRPEVKE